ncbi:hypothetical protein GJAV_G00094980 [Gymnothorax javanicus]|nr:hypothetical protein GJAV_G00094980 [Gymnothorax javanicus]
MPLGFGVFLFSVFIVADAQLSLLQRDLSLTRREDGTAIISCEVSGLGSNNYVHWYQKKDEEPFRRLLYISYGGIKSHDSSLTDEEKKIISKPKEQARVMP